MSDNPAACLGTTELYQHAPHRDCLEHTHTHTQPLLLLLLLSGSTWGALCLKPHGHISLFVCQRGPGWLSDKTWGRVGLTRPSAALSAQGQNTLETRGAENRAGALTEGETGQ